MKRTSKNSSRNGSRPRARGSKRATVKADANGSSDRRRAWPVRRKREAEHRGEFAVIDTRSEKLFLGDSPEAAYRAAREANLTGPFHFVRVGEPGVYRSTRPPRWRSRAAG